MGMAVLNAREWFIQIVKTIIGPLLEEYWFDAREADSTGGFSSEAQHLLVKK